MSPGTPCATINTANAHVLCLCGGLSGVRAAAAPETCTLLKAGKPEPSLPPHQTPKVLRKGVWLCWRLPRLPPTVVSPTLPASAERAPGPSGVATWRHLWPTCCPPRPTHSPHRSALDPPQRPRRLCTSSPHLPPLPGHLVASLTWLWLRCPQCCPTSGSPPGPGLVALSSVLSLDGSSSARVELSPPRCSANAASSNKPSLTAPC